MKNIEELRLEINQINNELLNMFSKRMEVSKEIFEYKRANNLPVLDRKREEEILQYVVDSSPEGIKSYSLEFFKTLMELSKDYQNDLK